MSPHVSGKEVSDLVRGSSRFAFDLFHELRTATRNVFFSPYSISQALAMTYAGARGDTETQMGEVLHFDPTGQEIHSVLNWLELELDERDQLPPPFEGEGVTLNLANAVWGQQGYGFLQDYLDTLAVNYGAGLRLVDFAGHPEGSRLAINDWVSDETKGRIEDLLPQSAIDSETRLVLTNAIDFKAPWLHPFDEGQTRDEPFTTLAGALVTVPVMHRAGTFPYARFDLGQAVELAYNGAQIAMVLLVPDAGEFETFEGGLDVDRYEEIVTALQDRRMDLGLPRFGFSCDVALPDALENLGMSEAFVPGSADFSGIDGGRTLFISGVHHQAFVAVNEAGTQAAAATAVVVAPTATPDPPIMVTIDRPFVLIIRDIPTGCLLFVGSVLNPWVEDPAA
jgi:serpin B